MTSFVLAYNEHQAAAPVVYLQDPRLQHHGVSLAIKREDLLHPEVSGNKWRKLKYNLVHAREQGYERVMSLGGAYSNHLHALASAGRIWDFTTIGIVRGEPGSALNPTLSHARDCGMQLVFVTRETYRRRHDPAWQDSMRERFGPCYFIPEGGSNALALQGVAEIWQDLQEDFDFIATATATGGTAAGLIAAQPAGNTVLALSVLKGGDFLGDDIRRLLSEYQTGPRRWRLVEAYDCGGYGRITPRLVAFMDDFEQRHGIPLDPVYTGKLMFGLYDLIERGEIPRGSRVLALHTGGLQGRLGMEERMMKMRSAAGSDGASDA